VNPTSHCYAYQVFGPGGRFLGIIFATSGWLATQAALGQYAVRDLFVTPRLTHERGGPTR
jgi:hypothetical protein